MPWRYIRWGAWEFSEFSEYNPRFFLHDNGTFAFSKYRFPSEDPVKIWRASTGPPFQFFIADGKDMTPDKFFHDDIQLTTPDLPGQPHAGAKYLPCSEADEYGYESDASDSSLEIKSYRRWARDLKWGQDSGLAIGCIRRTIWQSDRWGIDFSLEPVPGQLEFAEHTEHYSVKSYMVKATVRRIFVTKTKLESDATTQQIDAPGENSCDIIPSSERASTPSEGDNDDNLVARLLDTHIY